MVHRRGVHTKCAFVSEDTLSSVGENGTVSLSLRNTTATDNVVVKSKTVIDKSELTTFVFEPVFVEKRGEASALPFEPTNCIRTVDLNDTSSEFSPFSLINLSSTRMSEIGLSENEKHAKTDPQLLKTNPVPDLSSVLFLGG